MRENGGLVMPLDDLVQVIETIQRRITSYGPTFNETQTRVALIDPLLTALGWDVADPALVTPEYRTDVGWADYALQGPGSKPASVVEAKRLGSFVENHLDQMVGYCISQGIAYAAVTDGDHWQMYRTFDPVPLVQKRVLDVQISTTHAFECALKFLLLWKPNVETGRAIKGEKPVFPGGSRDGGGEDPPPPPGDWTPLPDFQFEGKSVKELTLKLPDGVERQLQYWYEIPIEIAEYLIRKGKLTAEKCPVDKSRGARLIHMEPLRSGGENFARAIRLSNGLFIEVHGSAKPESTERK